MINQTEYELHGLNASFGDEAAKTGLLFSKRNPEPGEDLTLLRISEDDRTVWAGVDDQRGLIREVDGPEQAVAGFRVVRGRVSTRLGMIAKSSGIMVNAFPALSFSVLTTKDSIRLSPNHLLYLTERVKPYVGAPPAELIGKTCKYCGIEFSSETRIVSCHCSLAYHWETEESHPHLKLEERLPCYEEVKRCLSCSRELTIEEYLTWDPSTI